MVCPIPYSDHNEFAKFAVRQSDVCCIYYFVYQVGPYVRPYGAPSIAVQN